MPQRKYINDLYAALAVQYQKVSGLLQRLAIMQQKLAPNSILPKRFLNLMDQVVRAEDKERSILGKIADFERANKKKRKAGLLGTLSHASITSLSKKGCEDKKTQEAYLAFLLFLLKMMFGKAKAKSKPPKLTT